MKGARGWTNTPRSDIDQTGPGDFFQQAAISSHGHTPQCLPPVEKGWEPPSQGNHSS